MRACRSAAGGPHRTGATRGAGMRRASRPLACRTGRIRLPADPLDLLAALGPSRGAFALTGPSWTRRGTTVLGLFPRATLTARGSRAVLRGLGSTAPRTRRHHGSPFRALEKWLDVAGDAGEEGLAGAPAWFGYLAYDLGRSLERLPQVARDDLRLPAAHLALHDALVEVTPGSRWGTLRIGRLGTGGSRRALTHRWEAAKARIEGMRAPAASPGGHAAQGSLARGGTDGPVGRSRRGGGSRGRTRRAVPASTFTREGYLRAVRRIRRHIREGDVYQVNLSQRFHVSWPRGWTALARPALLGDPAPYAGVFLCGDHEVLSLSPEGFLEVRGRRVVTRPIKGTRPRGRTTAEDRRLQRELIHSEKDRAELHMIVDLERNDLGRVCEAGSVRVLRPDGLETFSHVHHLVAEVEGRLRRGIGPAELLAATFPGGSITGCPKIRAMEILEGLEPVRRHVYTGAFGWIGGRGAMELAIAIRTVTLHDGTAFYGAGGGIVIESSPEDEYKETLHKGQAFFDLVEGMR